MHSVVAYLRSNLDFIRPAVLSYCPLSLHLAAPWRQVEMDTEKSEMSGGQATVGISSNQLQCGYSKELESTSITKNPSPINY